MQKLRNLHLYLGCMFAPLLVFFAVSGIWQMVGTKGSRLLGLLSTIHTSRGLKSPVGKGGVNDLSSPMMRWFVFAMAIAFIVTTVLGIIMTFKYGRNRRASLYCLAAGIVVPLLLVLIRIAA